MKHKRVVTFLKICILAAFLALMAVSIAYAQSGSGFDLTWNVIGGGGSQGMAGSGFSLNSTAGQSIVASSSGSGFILDHGFWSRLDQVFTFLSVIIKH